jgi:hypothetical protein
LTIYEYECDNCYLGRVDIDFPYPGRPCPKCHGTQVIQISSEKLDKKIADIKEIIKSYEDELKYLINLKKHLPKQ